MASTLSTGTLEGLLGEWRQLLQGWSADGSLVAAAREALRLDRDPPLLTELVGQWTEGNFSAIPPVVLLSAADMQGALGAYAISTGTIYLNADWLATATTQQVNAVLSEELGHHLDGLLNSTDTPGDEGELFAALLKSDGVISTEQRQRLLTENDQGSVVVNGEVWAVEQSALTSSPVRANTPGSTSGEFENLGAFAAIRADGSVVTWGRSAADGYSSEVATKLASGVSQIFSGYEAFAALKVDGSVVTWGKYGSGGDSSKVAAKLASGVIHVFSGWGAFAALKRDGSVVTWGDSGYGGDSSNVADQIDSNVVWVFSGGNTFSALKRDGSVVAWGDAARGGDSSRVGASLTQGVTQIFSNWFSFAALKIDGSVVTWGSATYGGDSSKVVTKLASGVTQIFSTGYAFAALKADGSVITWGDSGFGGDSSGVGSKLTSGVTQIFSTGSAFAALKANGSVVTWGGSTSGGDSSAVANSLASGVTQIFSTGSAFAALKANGSVVTWGGSTSGGDSSAVANSLASGVTQIFSNYSAFAALKSDGSVITWGYSGSGGDSSGVASRLRSDVTLISTSRAAFAALKSDGSVVTWGDPGFGGDSESLAGQLSGGVVAFANPFTNDEITDFRALQSRVSIDSPTAFVTEGGTNNLVFTFRRTELTSNAISVNYTVGGTASLGTDYTGILDTGTIKTVTFQAGASTTTVIVDPIADAAEEPDETVEIALAPGIGYTISSPNTAVGTITTLPGKRYFSREQIMPTYLGTSIELFDADGDGDLDILLKGKARWDSSFSVIENIGGAKIPKFSELTPETMGLSISDPSELETNSFALVDLDGDGDRDAFLTINRRSYHDSRFYTDYENDTVVYYENTKGSTRDTANFSIYDGPAYSGISLGGKTPVSWTQRNPFGLEAWKGGNLVFGDIDNDGDIDLFQDGIFVENTGNRRSPIFARREYMALPEASPITYSMYTRHELVDFDSDGDLDLFLLMTPPNTDYKGFITYRENIGSPTQMVLGPETQPWPFGLAPQQEMYQMFIAFGDLNGDGAIDAVISSPISGVEVFINKAVDNVVSLSVSPAAADENGSTNLQFTFSRTGSTTNPLTVNYTIGGTATLGTDYTGVAATPATKTVTFAAGSATTVVTVDPTADTEIEADETVALTLAAGSGYTIGTTTAVVGTITNDDFPSITLAVAPASVTEDGAANLIYTFSRAGATTSALTVNYTVGGTATFGTDYSQSGAASFTTSNGTITFAVGSATATLTVDPTADTTIEPDETVALTLAAGSGYTIGTTTAVTGTITNDDLPSITLAVSPASVAEDGTSNLIFTFSRTGPTTSSLTVNYTVSGTATLGTDYTGINSTGTTKTVSFAAGSATATVTVDPTADTAIEADDTVALTLATGSGYTIGTTTPVIGTITNDDGPVITLAVSPAAVREDGTSNLIFTFSRTGPTTSSLTVNYTVGGTASLGTDYTGISASGTTGKVVFAAGSSTATVTVDPTADTEIEADDTVALTLATGSGYTIGTTTPVIGTITNDDGPVITLAVSPAAVREDGTSNLIYTFSRTGSLTSAITINYTVSGTATLGTDYTGINSTGTTKTVSFAAGSATATVTVDPTADTAIEADDTVALTLATGSGYTIGTTTPVIGTITNDDGPVITLAVSPAAVKEDGTSNLIYAFSRTGSLTSAITINYTVSGTATLGTDYTGINSTGTTKTVSFAAGSATATVTVDPTADTAIEADDTVALTLATGSGYTIGTTTPVIGTITNDDGPVITLAVSPAAVREDGTSNLIFTLSRSGPATTVLSVNYTVDGSAALGRDYTGIAATPATKTISFAAGSATATVTVDPTADTSVESDETVILTLAAGSGYSIGANKTATGRILNDDVSSPTTRILAGNESSLLLTGTSSINGTGNGLNNTITGNAAKNILNGGPGNDILTGGLGADIFRFDSVLDATTNVDRITDFSPTANPATTDLIQLENTGAGLFTAITGTGTLAANAFISSSSAIFTTATQRILYQTTTGNLFYDADGNGTGASSILFATLSTGLALNNTHFAVT